MVDGGVSLLDIGMGCRLSLVLPGCPSVPLRVCRTVRSRRAARACYCLCVCACKVRVNWKCVCMNRAGRKCMVRFLSLCEVCICNCANREYERDICRRLPEVTSRDKRRSDGGNGVKTKERRDSRCCCGLAAGDLDSI